MNTFDIFVDSSANIPTQTTKEKNKSILQLLLDKGKICRRRIKLSTQEIGLESKVITFNICMIVSKHHNSMMQY